MSSVQEFAEDGTGTKARAWFLTINNPESKELPQHPSEKYAVWQLEKGESGTPHLQCTLSFSTQVHFGAIKKLYPRANIQKVKSLPAAIKYCQKEESRMEGPWTRGEPPKGQGKRTDLDRVAEMVEAGSSLREIARDHPTAYIKFHKGIKELKATLREDPRDEGFVPRLWQAMILRKLAAPPGDRKIIWVYDPQGNQGKSRLARHLILEHGALSLSGKVADMIYAYESQRIVIFDVSRTQSEHMKHLYDMAERLKNGVLFSTKYESRQKNFLPPHVIFFSNSRPDMHVWTEDRYDIMELEEAPGPSSAWKFI